MDALSPNQFNMNDIPVVKDLLTLNILLYDIDIVGWNNFGELARRNAQKYESTFQTIDKNWSYLSCEQE